MEHSNRNFEQELLEGVLDVLSTDLGCGANVYEIRQRIARLKMDGDKEVLTEEQRHALADEHERIALRLAKVEKQVESISFVINVAMLAVLVYVAWPNIEKLLFHKEDGKEVTAAE